MASLVNDLSRLSHATRERLAIQGQLFVGGEWRQGNGGTLPVLDPSSGDVIGQLACADASDVADAVRAAKRALSAPAWRDMAPLGRERLLWRLSDLVRANTPTLAELESVDVGMPLWLAQAAAGGASDVLSYMAGWPSKIGGRTVAVGAPFPDTRWSGHTVKSPVGVVGAIIPWNMPLMMAVWKLAPALAAGCTVVLKPAEDASLSVLHLVRLISEAGFPPGVVNVVTGLGAIAGQALAAHPDVDKITFTGSTTVGRHVARVAADTGKRVTLELGGKSPQLVFADVDLEKVVPSIANAIVLNAGQICVAGSRLYVARERYEELSERLCKHFESLNLGPGLDPATQVGPLISAVQRDRVIAHIDRARETGAEVLCGGYAPDAPGFYVRPTVVAAEQSSALTQQEVFGPVLTVHPFDDMEQAISLANDNDYGLAAYVWSRDAQVIEHAVANVRAGKVMVNTEGFPYPALPEGGVKASGYGRDLGIEAIEGFLETKSVLTRC
ncbi:aldehyde dehydrogenase [Pandoraea cepalis]|uniref:Aldehyde dehydrogenase n=1 Tax=Pandoraea cepalis TaxID=2508294 RepID=A0AAW7MHT8_9BURK|nr:aldehyde dehydrogenase family protein [Pandoraea cepalis]MDN4572269.1 aldehyde dehydrogenase [Pandoraea cepalis]MDN4576876.1 aldehyde dehydrogenase [Pandoraea cepalis]